MLNKECLHHAIDRFPEAKLLVVGDIAIDEMVYGNVDRLSREAPVVILKHRQTDIILGAAGNAAHNMAALGSDPTHIIAMRGDDHQATVLKAAMHRDKISLDGLLVDPMRPTTTKSRISGTANHSVTQQVVRIDYESRQPIPDNLEQEALDKLQALVPQSNGVLLSDYALGMMTPTIRQATLALAAKHCLPLAVDSQQALSAFAGADVLTPNQPEAEKNLGRPFRNEEDLVESGQLLREQSGAKRLLITRGQDGMALFDEDGQVHLIPVFNRSKVFDVTGAGDTVVATLLTAVSTGASYLEAAVLGNLSRQFSGSPVWLCCDKSRRTT